MFVFYVLRKSENWKTRKPENQQNGLCTICKRKEINIRIVRLKMKNKRKLYKISALTFWTVLVVYSFATIWLSTLAVLKVKEGSKWKQKEWNILQQYNILTSTSMHCTFSFHACYLSIYYLYALRLFFIFIVSLTEEEEEEETFKL